MKKLKQNLLHCSIFIVWTMAFVSCMEQKEYSNDEVIEFINPLNFVGEYHNKGLDYIIQKYPTCGYSKKSFQDTVMLVTSLLQDFVSTIPANSIINNNQIDKEVVKKRVSEIFIDQKNVKSTVEKLSKKQKFYIERLVKTLNDKNLVDSIYVFKSVSKLENEIWKSDLTDKEKYVILIATAVGKFSWKFWSQERFTQLFYQGSKDEDGPGWQKLKNVVLEGDIMGAIAGAIGGCIGGAVIGTFIMPGVGSITACILEAVNIGFQGAVIGSTISALKYLIFD